MRTQTIYTNHLRVQTMRSTPRSFVLHRLSCLALIFNENPFRLATRMNLIWFCCISVYDTQQQHIQFEANGRCAKHSLSTFGVPIVWVAVMTELIYEYSNNSCVKMTTRSVHITTHTSDTAPAMVQKSHQRVAFSFLPLCSYNIVVVHEQSTFSLSRWTSDDTHTFHFHDTTNIICLLLSKYTGWSYMH